MLIKLGRWLRTAGYDTKIAQIGMTDRQIIDQAVAEQRTLITRDRKMQEYREAKNTVVLLDCAEMDDCIEEVTRKLQINWLRKPFSRCLQCNTELRLARPEQLAQLPEDVQNSAKASCYCPHCDQFYWEGAHVKRMFRQLHHYAQFLGDHRIER